MPYEYNGSADTFTCNLRGTVLHRQKEIASARLVDAISLNSSNQRASDSVSDCLSCFDYTSGGLRNQARIFMLFS